MRRLVPSGGDWYSLVSAYGFHPDTREPNALAAPGGWQLPVHGEHFGDDWQPYRVFEPIEFLARGVCFREARS